MRNFVTLTVVAVSAGLCIAAGTEVADRQFPLLPATMPAALAPATSPALTDNVTDAKGLDYAIDKLKAPMRETDPLPPAEALKKFKPVPGLAIDLIAAEPDIRQPLCINFDERGRMWVVQYIQYPFPAGLKVVEYDKYIRAKFDKVPTAPPNHFAGKDVVTILEDVDRDGSFRKHKTFVSGLSIATSALPGRGGRKPGEFGRPNEATGADYGVWVMNTPYLLFYPDADRDDVPDSDPIIHLSGFGLEDTHAVASNLTWGPDGWLYGTQGSTCTAKVKTHLGDTTRTTDFLGQAIWRYHPERRVFEIFAEGGGNTFGLEFDDSGRAFSGTNWGKFRGLHFVQGGYYVKGWGKHGPLTNPYAFGWFEHMPHEGNADRLSHTFVVYGGTLFPQYRGKIISPNSLQSRIQLTRLEPMGSTYKTVEEPFLVTSDDGWFRPVDLKVGPDGAIYVADFYEKRISHVDPRDTWERGSGRIYRIRPADWKPSTVAMDLQTEPADKLVERLRSENRWERTTARRVLADRKDEQQDLPRLTIALQLSKGSASRLQREHIWALYSIGYREEWAFLAGFESLDPVVRTWSIRLAADINRMRLPSAIYDRLLELGRSEKDVQVRSQLASSARRLSGEQALGVVASMVKADVDAADPHTPLLLWWAVEPNCEVDKTQFAEFAKSLQLGKVGVQTINPRLARRLLVEPTPGNYERLDLLMSQAEAAGTLSSVLDGIKEALAGRDTASMPQDLRRRLASQADPELKLRFGDAGAVDQAIKIIADEKADIATRIRLIDAVNGRGKVIVTPLLKVAGGTKNKDVRMAAIGTLSRTEVPELSEDWLALYARFGKDTDVRTAIMSAMLGRAAWATALLASVQGGKLAKTDLSPTDIERLRQFEDPAVVALVEKVFGKAVRATDAEKAAEVERVKRLATTGVGDADRGKAIYAARCGTCHTLHGEGGQIGPDLTTYDRRNANDMAINIVDPSAHIREEFASFRVKTKGDEVYIGLITERSGDRLTLVDAARQKTTIAKSDIADERAMKQSLMPEGLMAGLSDQEIRDLFKYLAKP